MQRSKDAPQFAEQVDAIQFRLHQLKALCTFTADVSAAASPKAQVNEVQAETLGMVFQFFADELEAVHDHVRELRRTRGTG